MPWEKRAKGITLVTSDSLGFRVWGSGFRVQGLGFREKARRGMTSVSSGARFPPPHSKLNPTLNLGGKLEENHVA